jgi:hypothetical protein
MRVGRVIVSSTLLLALGFAASSEAQEPRVVGRKGAVAVSFDGSVSARQQTSQTPVYNSHGVLTGFDTAKEWTGDYQTFIDVGRFLTDHFVLDVGTLIGGSIGGASSDINTGIQGGARYYLTPSAPASVYVSGGGGVLTLHSEGNSTSAANVYGAGGLEAAVRQNASIFVEGQYERDFFEGEAQNSLRFKVGLRILF